MGTQAYSSKYPATIPPSTPPSTPLSTSPSTRYVPLDCLVSNASIAFLWYTFVPLQFALSTPRVALRTPEQPGDPVSTPEYRRGGGGVLGGWRRRGGGAMKGTQAVLAGLGRGWGLVVGCTGWGTGVLDAFSGVG